MPQPESCPGPLCVGVISSSQGKAAARVLALISFHSPARLIIISYAIMRQCWEEEPEDRPLFPDLYQDLLVRCPHDDGPGAELSEVAQSSYTFRFSL
jgi:hypothetical protein